MSFELDVDAQRREILGQGDAGHSEFFERSGPFGAPRSAGGCGCDLMLEPEVDRRF